MFAVTGGSNAAEEVGVGRENGLGGLPDGIGILVEGKFIEDEVAGEAAGGAGIGGEDFDAARTLVVFPGDKTYPHLHAHVFIF